jgi:hypothetical protein
MANKIPLSPVLQSTHQDFRYAGMTLERFAYCEEEKKQNFTLFQLE